MTAAVLDAPLGPPATGADQPRPVGPVAVVPRVLARAAELLPVIATGGVVMQSDLHGVMVAALEELWLGRDGHHRLELADRVLAQFASYLIAVGAVPFGVDTSLVLHRWVIAQDLAGVHDELRAAAGFWRDRLRPRQAGADPLVVDGGCR